MKKLFIPTALAVLFTTALAAQEAPKVDEKAAAAPAAASTAAPAAEKAADKAKTADAKADKAHAAPAKAHTAAKKEHHAAAHHSKVDRKLANELTDKLNAMTCPFAVPAATTVAPAPAADKAHVAAPAA